MILIVTGKLDGHVGAVGRHLDCAGVPWCRINVEDFPNNVDVSITPTTGYGVLFIKDSGIKVDIAEVGAVWYRKPGNIDLSHFEKMEPAALDYIEAEFNEILFGIYALLGGVYWINNPLLTRVAHRKLLQLKIASEVGFRTPTTLLTNDRQAAEVFGGELGQDMAIKSLGAVSVIQERGGDLLQYGIFTRRVNLGEIRKHGAKVQYMPTIFQEFIAKQAELRITCVGQKVFACKIEPRLGDETADDYRFDTTNLHHEAVDCSNLVDRMQRYMAAFGLNFGCFDFIVPASGGEPVFLEMNPNGQWLWVENKTGQPIGRAIAEDLIRHSDLSLKPKEKQFS